MRRACGVALVVLTACVPLRGGWDVAALERVHPELAAGTVERLGDLVPFPAFDFDRAERTTGVPELALVACRFPAGNAISWHAAGAGWPEGLGDGVVTAFARMLERFDLALVHAADGPAEIEIDARIEEGESAPIGLGDTLVECDVEWEGDSAGSRRVRGRIARAEIRMRRLGLDAAGRSRKASDAEWSGALLHELAHASGFSGHAAAGDSLLVREQSRLRDHGRAVLRGEPLADATLAAFHALSPGERLGARPVDEASMRWLHGVAELDRAWRRSGLARIAVRASAGDGEARLTLRYADGRQLRLRFPDWAEHLRRARPIVVRPDRATLEWLARARAQRFPVAPRLFARASSSPPRSFSPRARSTVP